MNISYFGSKCFCYHESAWIWKLELPDVGLKEDAQLRVPILLISFENVSSSHPYLMKRNSCKVVNKILSWEFKANKKWASHQSNIQTAAAQSRTPKRKQIETKNPAPNQKNTTAYLSHEKNELKTNNTSRLPIEI